MALKTVTVKEKKRILWYHYIQQYLNNYTLTTKMAFEWSLSLTWNKYEQQITFHKSRQMEGKSLHHSCLNMITKVHYFLTKSLFSVL